jgi:hypothetical protein
MDMADMINLIKEFDNMKVAVRFLDAIIIDKKNILFKFKACKEIIFNNNENICHRNQLR